MGGLVYSCSIFNMHPRNGGRRRQGFWQRKLWFPNRFFTLNVATITLIAIALTKLPVNLTIDTIEGTQVYATHNSNEYTKISSIIFLVTMLANFLPSLGNINDKELLMNIVALGILVITIIVNTIIQTFTQVHLLSIRAIGTLIFYVSLAIFSNFNGLTSRNILEHWYIESQRLVSNHQEKMYSSKQRKRYVKSGFNGVLEFDNGEVPPLFPEETHNCWSLVIVTLTTTAMTLPNITNGHFKTLLSSMRELKASKL
ncbi:hypothetical protein L1987_61282 [Smallanthus sonchifolius]|uniref:Uncharacterized protein n=1 Tax=Smallanthus sonchifolius TaxID=185202 RepID=A0ACB9DAG2_9ASTR|nr:hypothetical protein L1987_61282 [Smallanthus sonchifolius]